MAKLTLTDGTIFEGTTEEIFAITERYNGAKADEPEAEEVQTLLEVGDSVVILSSEKFHTFDYEEGEIATVTSFRYDGYVFVKSDTRDVEHMHPSTVRKATDEEVEDAKRKVDEATAKARKEAVFTQAGRKPNEYRKGDIITGYAMHRGETVVGEIKDVGETVMGVVDAKGYTAVNDFHPIVFVESRLDRN